MTCSVSPRAVYLTTPELHQPGLHNERAQVAARTGTDWTADTAPAGSTVVFTAWSARPLCMSCPEPECRFADFDGRAGASAPGYSLFYAGTPSADIPGLKGKLKTMEPAFRAAGLVPLSRYTNRCLDAYIR